jgi:hypothetical protein
MSDPSSQPEAGHPQIPGDSEPQWDLFGSPYSYACNGVGVVKVSLIIEHTHYSTRRPGHLSSNRFGPITDSQCHLCAARDISCAQPPQGPYGAYAGCDHVITSVAAVAY